MVYGIYSSAAGLMANQYRQEVLANNLANVQTAGFKQDLTILRERQPASGESFADSSWSERSLAGLTGGALVAPTSTSFEPGSMETTGNPMDVAITGEGFFKVRADGTERYTRDGRFTFNSDGELVTANGQGQALDEGGGPIRIPTALQGRARIDANGEVRVGSRGFGRLGVVEFDDRSLLRKTGGNLMEALGARANPTDAVLVPGAIEGSNVDPTRTMVSMIEVTRAYQMNATMVSLADQTLGRAVNDIARIK